MKSIKAVVLKVSIVSSERVLVLKSGLLMASLKAINLKIHKLYESFKKSFTAYTNLFRGCTVFWTVIT
jgi:hypothetical protein